MRRALIAISFCLCAVSLASADIPPCGGPRPPFYSKDLPAVVSPRILESKLVPVEYKIATEKEYPDYLFFTLVGKGKERTVTSVKLDPVTPVTIASLARGDNERVASFVAVPREMRNKYDKEDDFHTAIKEGKVKGLVRSGYSFDPLEKVTSYSPPSSIVKIYVLEKIDPREGITLSEKPDATMNPDSPAKDANPPGENKSSSSYVPAGRIWIAGLAGSAALVLAGFWLVGRNRQP
jgi:hypothetical protein